MDRLTDVIARQGTAQLRQLASDVEDGFRPLDAKQRKRLQTVAHRLRQIASTLEYERGLHQAADPS